MLASKLDGAGSAAFVDANESGWVAVAACAERSGTDGEYSVASYVDSVGGFASDESVLKDSEVAGMAEADAKDFDALSSGPAEDTVELPAGDDPI